MQRIFTKLVVTGSMIKADATIYNLNYIYRYIYTLYRYIWRDRDIFILYKDIFKEIKLIYLKIIHKPVLIVKKNLPNIQVKKLIYGKLLPIG